MQVRDLSHPKSSKALNESVAKNFGYKLNVDRFTTEELCAARDKITSKLVEFETSKNFDAVYESHEYHKDRALLDVITQAITERKKEDDKMSPEQKKKKEKYVKGMKKVKGDFTKRYGKRGEEVMHRTATKMAQAKDVNEAMNILRSTLNERVLTEGEEEKAALIMSSRDMVDKITGWLEDTASLKAEALLELIDSIRDELGSDTSIKFAEKVKPALEEIYTVLETQRQTLAQAVSILTGEEAPTVGPEGAPQPAPGEEETGLEGEMAAAGDEFAASAPAAGGTAEAGREKRESIEYSRRLGTLLSSKKN